MKGTVVTLNEGQQLVDRAKAGDSAAFEELLTLHRDRLESWIRSRLGDRVRQKIEVDDVVQETQLRAFQSIERFTWLSEDSFLNWLQTIAEHVIWNVSRKRSTDELRLTTDRPKSSVSSLKKLQRGERFDRLGESLNRLREDERQALCLSRLEGLKIKEIAERLNRTESAVKSLITRSLRKLREYFGDTESLHLPDLRLHLGDKEDRKDGDS